MRARRGGRATEHEKQTKGSGKRARRNDKMVERKTEEKRRQEMGVRGTHHERKGKPSEARVYREMEAEISL